MGISITSAYLVAYNAVQAFGWVLVLSKLVHYVGDSGDLRGAYAAVGDLVCPLQLAAFLEVLHAALGLVRSGTLNVLMQWGGRIHVLLGIIAKLPEVQVQHSVFIIFAAWSMMEVIRYPQYALTRLGLCPTWLTWLRYTMFIGLYPAGVYGEMHAMYSALDLLRSRQLYANIFGRLLSLTYAQFVMALLVVYPFLFAILYFHMFKQRKSKLRTRSSGKQRSAGQKRRD